MESNPDCQCCNERKASDVHHMVYRNIVDIKVTDLLPVCRPCYDTLHDAISNNYIPNRESHKFSIEDITKMSIGILTDEKYKSYKRWLDSKHNLKQVVLDRIKPVIEATLKQIRGIKRIQINDLEDLATIEFTGRQIEKVMRVIRIAEHRRQNKLDKRYNGRAHKTVASNYSVRTSQPKHPIK